MYNNILSSKYLCIKLIISINKKKTTMKSNLLDIISVNIKIFIL